MDTNPPTVSLENFGERLRRLRAAAGISQDVLARRAGLSTVGVGSLERGTRRAPQPQTIVLLANALGLSPSERADLEEAAQRGRARIRTQSAEAVSTTHNLPFQLTSFVGRADQVEQLTGRISSSRLVTVVGSGGVGKTRIALEVAMRLAVNTQEEVRFVDLAPLQIGTFIVGRVAGVLDVRLSEADESPESLARALKIRRVLLVLDNCEHLLADATRTARVLLERCPNVRILATTRERLSIMGEVVHRLPPMALPDDGCPTIADARCASAIELFLQRTHSADADLTFTDRDAPMLIDVCRRLQGIPLAIELVAAHVPTLGLETVSRHLEATLGVARGTRGVPDRQQTMRDTIAWSYDLLSESERSLLRRLAIFAGGGTLAAVESVCTATDLQSADVPGLVASLVDKSLVNAVIDGERMRYVLLDSTRAFARERLAEADEQAAYSRRHAQWLATYGEHVAQQYLSEPNLVWLEEFGSEIDNVRSALEWALHGDFEDDVLRAARIAGSFRGLWLIQAWNEECRYWVMLLLERIDEKKQPHLVANLLAALAQTLAGREALSALDRLVTVLRLVGDSFRLATALADLARRYCDSGLLAQAQDAIEEAYQILVQERMREAPASRLGRIEMKLLNSKISLSLARRQFAEARAFIDEATVLSEAVGDEYASIRIAVTRAEAEFVAGETALAAKYSEEAVKLAEAIARAPSLVAHALCIDAGVRLSTSDIRGGEAAARRAFHLVGTIGESELQLISLQNLAAAAIRRGRLQIEARLLGCIEAWREAVEYQRSLFEEAMYSLLLTWLGASLGPDLEMEIAEGRRLDLELAAEEVLSMELLGGARGGS